MSVVIPLDKMTTQEKLCALEELWDDLAHTPANVPSPGWHGEELSVREERFAKGLTHFSDWAEVKDRIRGQVQ